MAAAAPASATPVVSGAFDGDVVCDGGFETEGQTGPSRPELTGPCWFDLTGDGFTGLARFSTQSPMSGMRSLELCGYTTCLEAIGHTFSVPTGVTSATLSADMRLAGNDTSFEDCAHPEGDIAAVIVQSQDGMSVDGVTICEDGSPNWQHFEQNVTSTLQAVEGQEMGLYVYAFTGANDAGEMFWIDNVSLLVTATEGPVVFERQIALGLSGHLKARGAVTRGPGAPKACISRVTVKFQRKTPDGWKTLEKTTTTDSEGFYDAAIPDKPGNYRSFTPAKKLTNGNRCIKATSPTRNHSH